ncbi:MAG: type II secretion system protein, partial [Intestinibacter sp.]
MEKEKFIMKRAGEKNKIRKMFKNELGITLIALVVTIVILLILAGITINMLLGEGGIIKTAQDAKNTWEGAVTNEQEAIQNLVNELNEVMGGNGEQEEPWVAPNTVKEAIEQDRIFEKTVTIKDEENQNVTVPEGFKVKPDAELVNDGIVIEDEIGNQFVWIPVED